MDGINPTLGFAAIFLGLAGHPRDAAETQIEQPQVEQPADPQCAPFADVMGGAQTTDDFGKVATSPVFLDPVDGGSTRFKPFEHQLPMMAGRYVVGPMRGDQAAAAGPYQANVDLNAETLRAFRAEAASGPSDPLDCPGVPPVP